MRSLLLAAALLASAPAHADPPTHRLVWDSLTAVRVNPLGLQEYVNLAWRMELFDSDSVLLSDAHFRVGPTLGLSPAWVKPGILAVFKPTAMTELSAGWRYQSYFGNFDQPLGYSDPSTADWSDSAIEARGDEARAAGGWQAVLGGRLQAAVGPVAVRETVRLEYNALDLPEDAVAFYDQTPDMLVPLDGWLLVSDLDAIALLGPVKAGARWTWTAPYFGEGDKSLGNDSHRVGPLVTYTFRERPGATIANPTALLLAQWHVKHPFRTGQDVSQALPYLALGFLFEGDLVPWDE